MKYLFKLIKNNKGFSLLEAIITIAIVGIVFLPIAMIFNNSTKSSIDTKEQLIANELAQQYMENLKVRSYSSFLNFFGGGTSITLDSSNSAIDNLPVLPEGYEVVISYNSGTYDSYELSTYDYDFTLDINLNNNSYVITDASNNTTNGISDTLYILYDYTDNRIKFSQTSHNSPYQGTIDANHMNFKVNLSGSTVNDYNISIKNELPSYVNAYIDNSSEEVDKLKITSTDGLLAINSLEGSHIIYEVNINVIKDGESKANITGTKIID